MRTTLRILWMFALCLTGCGSAEEQEASGVLRDVEVRQHRNTTATFHWQDGGSTFAWLRYDSDVTKVNNLRPGCRYKVSWTMTGYLDAVKKLDSTDLAR